MIDLNLTPDEADLVVRTLKWAATACDHTVCAHPSNGTIIFSCQHSRDRCNELAFKISQAIEGAA